MRVTILLCSLVLSGCWSNGQSYVDWGGVWFGCPKGQVEHPAVRGMFGMVKQASYCESVCPASCAQDPNRSVCTRCAPVTRLPLDTFPCPNSGVPATQCFVDNQGNVVVK